VTSEIDNALRRATPVTVTLPANVLQPDGQTELNVRLHGATEGIHNIRWLFTFSHPVRFGIRLGAHSTRKLISTFSG
jgi:hypothetical protein